ncbi:MAG: hypothetical protein P8Y75_13515 [Nitrospirota bacterium]
MKVLKNDPRRYRGRSFLRENRPGRRYRHRTEPRKIMQRNMKTARTKLPGRMRPRSERTLPTPAFVST